MIEIKKKNNCLLLFNYRNLLLDCFFDRVMSLIDTSRKFSETNEFIDTLVNEFPNKYAIILFGGKVLLICRELIEFIIKIKEEDEKIKLSHCVTDFISDGNEILEICSVCFIKIVEKNRLLQQFKTVKKIRGETYYIYL